MEAATTPEQLEAVISLGDQLEEMVGPLRHTLEQGEKREEMLREAANDQKQENIKMRRALRMIDPNFTPPGVTKRRKKPSAAPAHVGITRANGTATGFGISVEACGRFVDEIRKQTKTSKFFTQKAIYKAIDEDQTKASSAFRWLRAIGFLARAGRDPESRRERWKVLDDTAYDKAVKAATEATEEKKEEAKNNG
jgi:hypothetical protein